LLGGVGVSLYPKLDFSKPRTTTEVELVDIEKVEEMIKQAQNQKLNGQIVQQSEQRLNDEVPVDSKFLSRHNQKVAQETQAEKNAAFRNTNSKSGDGTDSAQGKDQQTTAKKQEEQKQKNQPEKEVMTAENGIATSGKKPSLKDLTPSFRPTVPTESEQDLAAGNGQGQSATDDQLKNVKSGMQTLLSTREFVYYSYYNRIREKLRQYWEPKIKEKFERIVRQGRTIASEGDRITRIIIILDDKGILKKVQVVSGSGVTDLDDAAVEAFRAAAPFPNPPKGIVETDGMIRIRWDFVLEANAGLFEILDSGIKAM
jgi:protein TonB